MPISRISFTECCVGLVFSSPAALDVGHERHVHLTCVLVADLDLHLADRLEERERLDVADGAADLDDRDVYPFAPHGRALYLVGDVRNDLHRRAKVLAPPLLRDDRS